MSPVNIFRVVVYIFQFLHKILLLKLVFTTGKFYDMDIIPVSKFHYVHFSGDDVHNFLRNSVIP